MVSKISLIAIAVALLCGSTAQATLETPIKSAIDQAVTDAMQKIFQGVGTVANTAGSVAAPVVTASTTAATQLFNDYKTMGQTVLNSYKTLGNQMLGSLTNVGNTLGVAYDQLETVLSAYEAQFCTPARYTPSMKKPAKFYGPAFELEISAGSCEFDEELFIEDNMKVLHCIEPSITFTKTPANFTSKYKSAPKFVSKECEISKKFGDEIQKVLYVFDGTGPLDLNNIVANVMAEIRQVTGTIGSAHQALTGQLTSFLGSVPHVGGGFKLA